MRATPELLTGPLASRDGQVVAGPPVDVLGDLLDTLRLDTVGFGRFELGTAAGLLFPDDDLVYLIAVGRGDARLQVDGVDAALMLGGGDVALLSHGRAHQLTDAEAGPLTPLTPLTECLTAHAGRSIGLGADMPRTTLVICALRFGAAHRTLSQRLPRSVHIAGDNPSASPGLAATAQLLVAESSSRRPGAAVIMNRLADILLVQTIRTYIASRDCPVHSLRALTDPQIASALTLLHGKPDEPWTVEQLAHAVALSRSAFAARFSALVGAPPADYLARLRMTKAAEFLRDGMLTTSQIAIRTGYSSETSFNRAFKRIEGITPGAYRRHLSVGDSPATPEQRPSSAREDRHHPTEPDTT